MNPSIAVATRVAVAAVGSPSSPRPRRPQRGRSSDFTRAMANPSSGGAGGIAAATAAAATGAAAAAATEHVDEENQPRQRQQRTLLATFAAIADIQHADHEDAPSFSGITRRYRDALLTARDSALSIAEEKKEKEKKRKEKKNTTKENETDEDEERESVGVGGGGSGDVEFILHLGDLVDMKAASESRPREAFRRALEALSLSGVEQAHVLGNHCLYSWPATREELHEELGLLGHDDDDDDDDGDDHGDDGEESREKGSSSFCPERGYYARSYGRGRKLRLVVLDGFDVSIFGRRGDPKHPKRLLAESILRSKNPNNEAGGWFSAEGLVGLDRRFVCFGGGVGEEQLRWLSSQLERAERRGQRVVVAVHQPLLPATSNPLCLLWNYDEVLRVLEPFGKRGTVVATLSGHSHKDGSGVCRGGVLHRVVRGVIEFERGGGGGGGEGDDDCGDGGDRSCCHVVVDVFDDGSVVVKGRGCDDSEHFRV